MRLKADSEARRARENDPVFRTINVAAALLVGVACMSVVRVGKSHHSGAREARSWGVKTLELWGGDGLVRSLSLRFGGPRAGEKNVAA